MGKDQIMDNKQKLLFILAIVISNTFTYLLFFTPIENSEVIVKDIVREGYQKVNIKAQLKTPTVPGLPITISDNQYKKIFRNSFFISKLNQSSDGFIPEHHASFSEVTIEVPKENVLDVIKLKSVVILPHNFKIKLSKRSKKYEINY